ncbi:Kdo hydroxylase family protein [soil metagenome]
MVPPPSVDVIDWRPDTRWSADPTGAAPTTAVEAVVEAGRILAFPSLGFTLAPDEARFLDPRWAAPGSKNISVRGAALLGADDGPGELRGAPGGAHELIALRALIVRFGDSAQALVSRLFPHYAGKTRRGNTSLRTQPVEHRAVSWRQDDTRLHVDAFPSNPSRGTRLLRVFTNLNPDGRPRSWRVGEPFEPFARRFAARLKRPWPGSAQLLHALRITKAPRTEYDALMLQLHDLAKSDAGFQDGSPQQSVDFMPGTTWIVFSDQVLHAAMGGQHMLEQTFYLDPDDQLEPAAAPLAILERLTHRTLRPARRGPAQGRRDG